jgi:Uma2 family endonuclease
MDYGASMASTKAPPTGLRDAAHPVRIQPPAFPGCKPVRVPCTEIDRFEKRLEYWDSATETAWISEPTTPYHERPSRRLTRLAGQIAAVRGAPIECYGSMDLLLRDPAGEPRRIMQADESVYLHPGRRGPGLAAMVVGEDDFPDVVLEVDHTTDVRRGKLDLYESWSFPEVWVEVPDAPSPSRPHRRRPGLTIHLLEHGRFRVADESRAFPGWRADEIHLALNEPVLSEQTSAALQRVAASLGAREGTGPDDDLLLGAQRRQGFDHGRAKGYEEGHAEGRIEGRTEARKQMVRQILRSRGIAVSARLDTAAEKFAAASDEALLAAAHGCTDEADLLAALPRPSKPGV